MGVGGDRNIFVWPTGKQWVRFQQEEFQPCRGIRSGARQIKNAPRLRDVFTGERVKTRKRRPVYFMNGVPVQPEKLKPLIKTFLVTLAEITSIVGEN